MVWFRYSESGGYALTDLLQTHNTDPPPPPPPPNPQCVVIFILFNIIFNELYVVFARQLQ